MIVFCWTAGYVLATISRQAVWSTGSLYVLLCSWPLLLALTLPIWGRGNPDRSPGLEVPLALSILTVQIVIQAVLVTAPAILGLYHGNGVRVLSVRQSMTLASVTASVAGLAIWLGGWQEAALVRWSGGIWSQSIDWQQRLPPLAVLCWPAAYLLARAFRDQRSIYRRL